MTILLSLKEKKSLPVNNRRLFFSPKNRLLTPQDFQRVFKQGRKQRGVFFTFIFAKNDLGYARLGLAIAKRYVPLAVNRNRIRRIIRESFRHYQRQLGNVDIVVIAQRELQSMSNAVLREEVNQRWQK